MKQIGKHALARIVALSLAAAGAPAFAQAVNWTVIGSSSSAVPMPPMQAASDRVIGSMGWSDGGQGRWGYSSSQSSDDGLWARSPNGTLQRYMAPGVIGAAGPGRSGAEFGHVFGQRFDQAYDSGRDGRRAFVARAGIANQYSDGVWLWDGTRNVEIARSVANAGALGPGLGPDWRFNTGDRYALLRVGNGGEVLIDTSVVHSGGSTSELITKYVPGVGNRACAMPLQTDPLLSPGLGTDVFSHWVGAGSRSVDANGRMYAQLLTEGFRTGVWEVCNGAPRALAVDAETAARGPGIPLAPEAVFATFNTGAVLGAPGLVNFIATVFLTPQSGSPTNGVYRNSGASNRPLALAGDTGDLSPHWNGATFSSFVWESLDAGGSYVTFSAYVNTAGGSRVGIWRAGKPAGPQPVAIIGDTGAYGPGGGLAWSSFSERSITAGGDIVVIAKTSDGTDGVWRLSESNAPVRLLGVGDAITVPTSAGTAQATVTAISSSGGANAARPASGRDTWIGTDGSALLNVRTTFSDYTLWITAPATDRIFADGFNG